MAGEQAAAPRRRRGSRLIEFESSTDLAAFELEEVENAQSQLRQGLVIAHLSHHGSPGSEA